MAKIKTLTGEKKRYKNWYWKEEDMQSYLQAYRSTEDMTERNRIFDLMYPSFYEMAHAIVCRHRISPTSQTNIAEMIHQMVCHGHKAIEHYKVGTRSFPYFNVVMMRFLFQDNQKQSEYADKVQGFDMFIEEGRNIDESTRLQIALISKHDDGQADYVKALGEHWDKYLNYYIPPQIKFHEAALVVRELLFGEHWCGDGHQKKLRGWFIADCRGKYLKQFGTQMKRVWVTQALRVMRRVNEQLRHMWVNGSELEKPLDGFKWDTRDRRNERQRREYGVKWRSQHKQQILEHRKKFKERNPNYYRLYAEKKREKQADKIWDAVLVTTEPKINHVLENADTI